MDFSSQQVKLFPSPNAQIVSGARDSYSAGTADEVARAQRSLLTSFMSSVELNLYPPDRPSWVSLHILQPSNCLTLKMGPTGFPETSVNNYQSTLHDIPGDQKSQGVVVCLTGAVVQ